MNKSKIIKFGFLSLIIIIIGIVFYNTPQQTLGQQENEPIDFKYSAIRCPVNVSEIIKSPFLTTDFTTFDQDAYADYLTSFQQEAYSSVISEMANYYSESYSNTLEGPLDNEIMQYVVKSHDSAYIAGENISNRLEIDEEISECIDKKLQIVVAIEKSILNSEYQTYVSQSILGMMSSMQEDLNYYRSNILENQVNTYSNQASEFPFKP